MVRPSSHGPVYFGRRLQDQAVGPDWARRTLERSRSSFSSRATSESHISDTSMLDSDVGKPERHEATPMDVMLETSTTSFSCLSDIDLNEDLLPRTPNNNRYGARKQTWGRCVTAPPAIRVGDWTLHGDMYVLHDNSKFLSNSTVTRAVAQSPGHQNNRLADVAVKIVPTDGDGTDLEMMRRELRILKELGDGHPNILPMLGCTEVGKDLVMLMKLASDGDLSKVVPPGSCLPCIQVRRLNLQLVSALQYLHSKRIVHGDVKPQNMLLTSAQGALLVQLGDYGLARKIPEGEKFVRLESVQGSYGFIPAEVKFRKELGFAADLFALGVVTFRLLASYEPFHPASCVEAPLQHDPHCWSPLSQQAKSYTAKLLDVDPEKRGTAAELLQGHPWLTIPEGLLVGSQRGFLSPRPLDGVVFHDLKACKRIWLSDRFVHPQSVPEADVVYIHENQQECLGGKWHCAASPTSHFERA